MALFDFITKPLAEYFVSSLSEERIRIEYDRMTRGGNLKEEGKASSNIIPFYRPHSSVKLQEWRQAIDYAKSPYHYNRTLLYDVYDRVMIDLELSRLLQKQIEHLQKAKFRLIDANGDEDKEAIKLFENLWWWDYVQYVIEADAYGHSLMEIYDLKEKPTSFTIGGRKQLVRELDCITLIDRKHVKPEFGLWVIEEQDQEGYSFRTEEMKPYYMEAGGSHDLGYLFKVSPIEITKRYAIGTWSEFNEKIAFPFRWATMPTGNKTRQRTMAKILTNMGSAGWGIFHQGEEVKLLEMSKTDPHKCFKELIQYCDRKMEAFIEGEGLKNEQGEGSFAADKVRSDMKIERYRTNKTYLEYFTNDQLLPRLVMQGYPLQGYRIEADDKRDIPVEEQVKIDAELLKHYKISPEFIAGRYGIPVEDIELRIGGRQAMQPENLADYIIESKKGKAVQVAKPIKAYGNLYRQNKMYYKPCSHAGSTSMEEDDFWPNFDEDMEAFARRVFDGEVTAGQIDAEVFAFIELLMHENIERGFEAALSELEFGSPDYLLLENLLRNSSTFAAFKNHQNVELLVSLLVDTEGNARTFSQFKELAEEVNEAYNSDWLRAEFETARGSARMASNWQRLISDSENSPNLTYITANDDRVRPSHQRLDGITLPVSNSFWNTWYPPNGWRCRCDAVGETADAAISEEPQDLPEPKDGFGHNPGQSKMVFDDNHPYIKNATQEAREEVSRFLRERQDGE